MSSEEPLSENGGEKKMSHSPLKIKCPLCEEQATLLNANNPDVYICPNGHEFRADFP